VYVIGEVCKQNCCHVCQIESLSLDQGKGDSETDASVFEYFKDQGNRELAERREALMSRATEWARNSNIPFKASRGWF
jgi:hypothetical protein